MVNEATCMRNRIWPLVLGALILSCAARLSSATLNEYHHTLTSIAHRLEVVVRAEKAIPGSGKKLLNKAEKEVPSSIPLVLPSGKQAYADLGWIKDEIHAINLLKSKYRPKRIQELIIRIRTAIEAQTAVPSNDLQFLREAKSSLNSILERREYRQSIVQNWLMLISEAISNAVNKVFGAVAVRPVGYVLGALVLLVFVACVVKLVLRFVNNTSRPPDKRSEEPNVERKKRQESIESLIRTAESEAAQGRYRESLRNVYLATLLLLDRAGLITFTESTTNWEYIHALRGRASSAQIELFRDLTSLFDVSIYGGGAVSFDDYMLSRRRFEEMGASL